MLAIRILGLTTGRPSPFDGQWLVEYDPTRPGRAPDGRPLTAHIVCSLDPTRALRFNSAAEAHTCWISKSGKPSPADMPLTAFNIAVEPVEW